LIVFVIQALNACCVIVLIGSAPVLRIVFSQSEAKLYKGRCEWQADPTGLQYDFKSQTKTPYSQELLIVFVIQALNACCVIVLIGSAPVLSLPPRIVFSQSEAKLYKGRCKWQADPTGLQYDFKSQTKTATASGDLGTSSTSISTKGKAFLRRISCFWWSLCQSEAKLYKGRCKWQADPTGLQYDFKSQTKTPRRKAQNRLRLWEDDAGATASGDLGTSSTSISTKGKAFLRSKWQADPTGLQYDFKSQTKTPRRKAQNRCGANKDYLASDCEKTMRVQLPPVISGQAQQVFHQGKGFS
jgi:hypothetical protein